MVADWGVHHRSCDAYPLMGGTFDNVDQGAVVWGEYAGFWLVGKFRMVVFWFL